jgi:hypothetical protein
MKILISILVTLLSSGAYAQQAKLSCQVADPTPVNTCFKKTAEAVQAVELSAQAALLSASQTNGTAASMGRDSQNTTAFLSGALDVCNKELVKCSNSCAAMGAQAQNCRQCCQTAIGSAANKIVAAMNSNAQMGNYARTVQSTTNAGGLSPAQIGDGGSADIAPVEVQRQVVKTGAANGGMGRAWRIDGSGAKIGGGISISRDHAPLEMGARGLGRSEWIWEAD